jgi:glycosyltransferase involved in cell wall biosynthesis
LPREPSRIASSSRSSFPFTTKFAPSLAVIERLQAIDLPVAREILVINDGSTDGTREVLESGIGDRGPGSVIHVSPNAGRARRFARGFNEARGTIVAIQDADLELDPQQLSALVTPFCAVRRASFMARGSSRAVRGALVTIAANRR